MSLDNIIKARMERNISQKEMVEFLNVTKGTYSAWESGSDIIPLNRLNDICNYFNISIDYALGLTINLNYDFIDKDLNKQKIGIRMKDIRKENRLTLKGLAKKINTSASVISRYENGKTLILTSFIYEYAKHFNVSIDYLLGRTDNPKYLNK